MEMNRDDKAEKKQRQMVSTHVEMQQIPDLNGGHFGGHEEGRHRKRP